MADQIKYLNEINIIINNKILKFKKNFIHPLKKAKI